jgi:predicted CXXCH cytochrome family protein
MNPHGPGFNAETLREKNAQMCTACHGVNVPNPD